MHSTTCGQSQQHVTLRSLQLSFFCGSVTQMACTCRRVSNAHVRSQLPYKDTGGSSQEDQQDPDEDREVCRTPVTVRIT